MRIFLVLICSIALASLALGAEEGKKKEQKKGAQTGQVSKPGGKPTGAGKQTGAGGPVGVGKATGVGKPFKAQKFNLPTKTTPTKVAAVNFQQGRHIQGSQNWQGSNYQVFRNYKSEWHDQGWWRSHYNNRVVFVYGGWYAWNAG